MKGYILELLQLGLFNQHQNNRIIQMCFTFTMWGLLQYSSAQGL